MPAVQVPDPSTVVETIDHVVQRPAPTVGAPALSTPYKIFRTNQVDEYERPAPPGAPGAPAPHVPPVDTFEGTARKPAKISVAAAPIEDFAHLKALIASLEPDKNMSKLHLPDDVHSDRVAKEKRNVRVRAFIHAASREADNDFHVIIGREAALPTLCMNVEISGLPPAGSAHRTTLEQVRDAYKSFFGHDPKKLPGAGYDFYHPPIPVRIAGSIFYDVTHEHGGKPGPADLRDHIPTIWEIHPVTNLEFL
jgi:hypothetical protein